MSPTAVHREARMWFVALEGQRSARFEQMLRFLQLLLQQLGAGQHGAIFRRHHLVRQAIQCILRQGMALVSKKNGAEAPKLISGHKVPGITWQQYWICTHGVLLAGHSRQSPMLI